MSDAVKRLFVSITHTLRECMVVIDQTGKGIVLVVDEDGRLLGTVTDGDIRRVILANMDVDSPVQVLLDQRAPTHYPTPVTAPMSTSDTRLLQMMNQYSLRHIPLVDETKRIVDVVLLSDLVKEYELPLTAVVMAGGFGTRLYPLTKEYPKPMLPVGERPLLELIIKQLRQAGIRRVNLTVHYKAENIAKYFGDGRDFGVDIRYVKEEQPLGTAGSLGMFDPPDEPLLVINGDILTRIDFRAMLDFHREHQADMTVAVRQYEFPVPYGVVETDGIMVIGISEKPVVRQFINAGIYLLNPEMCRCIPRGQSYDMPDLISRLVADGRRVVSFPFYEYWLDIGAEKDFHQANEGYKKNFDRK